MIFFVANDGTIVKSFPEPVYQGSVGANEISIVSPFSPSYTVTAAFTLPNGVYIGPYPLTAQGEIPGLINKATGLTYSGWRLQTEADFTKLYGTVTVQFYFYSPSGQLVATSSSAFSVGRGVPAQLPPTPSADSWSKILAAISAIQSDLQNGYFAARSLLPWKSDYVYGANEFVWYPEKGVYGMLLKSLTATNNNPPYLESGALNSAYWQEVLDFSVIQSLYDLNAVLLKAQAAQAGAETAQRAAETAQQGAITAQQGAEQAQGEAVTAKEEAQSAQSLAEAAAQRALESAGAAAGSEGEIKSYAEAAQQAAQAAQTAQSGALDAKTAAETAQSQALSAKESAETAQTAAETAQQGALTAKSEAQSAAEAAQTSAQSAQSSAEAAKKAQEAAQSALGDYYTKEETDSAINTAINNSIIKVLNTPV